MTDQSPEFRFDYEDKNGKVSTNRPEVVQWAVAIKLVAQGLAYLILAAGAVYTLYARGGDVVTFLSRFVGK
ncbi:hypothetical protein JJB99_23620 [Bradyrhizobium diazoefficiens]|uniref:hypothetical protein n=1 Tax=Bradyrhizobium diazoefficiens TaxID=1355477 RepID=UPI00190C2F13|nr:hypothetical protein [Bradyrhizobium diazoefficiens]QQO12455.1 hypothetical protein JJB99_23620 [Bradyrhizobium diazoefficiens]